MILRMKYFGIRGVYKTGRGILCMDGYNFFGYYHVVHPYQRESTNQIVQHIKRGDFKRNKIKKFLINKNSSKQK